MQQPHHHPPSWFGGGRPVRMTDRIQGYRRRGHRRDSGTPLEGRPNHRGANELVLREREKSTKRSAKGKVRFTRQPGGDCDGRRSGSRGVITLRWQQTWGGGRIGIGGPSSPVGRWGGVRVVGWRHGPVDGTASRGANTVIEFFRANGVPEEQFAVYDYVLVCVLCAASKTTFWLTWQG